MIYKNVEIGKKAKIGSYVEIGVPIKQKLKTKIGDNANIRSFTAIYAGNKIGNNFSTGHHVLIRELNKIGDNVSIGSFSDIEHHVIIENGVRIHSRAFIPEFSIIKKKAWIGPGVIFTNALHPLCPKVKKCLKGPTIEENAKIGAGSVILPYVTIGKNSLIGAGSVVTKNIPPNSVAVGNPAKVVKKISEIKCPFGLIKNPYL